VPPWGQNRLTNPYGYDLASQLTSVTPSTGTANVYTYDKLGRRLTSKAGTSAAVTYTYDAASQLTAIGSNAFTYDPAGRRLTDTTTATNKATYTYDQAGRLATITRINGAATTTQTRAYTPSNLLASISNLTGTTTTATGIDWDTAHSIPQPVDFVGTALTDLVHGPGGWAATKVAATNTAVAQDVYGSAVPSTGVTIARNATYTAFGTPAGTNTFEPRLGYRGELTLDNLLYLRARNYDPTRGQFTSRDRIDGQPGTVVVANPYHYANNRPLVLDDPSGLFPGDSKFSAVPESEPRCTQWHCGWVWEKRYWANWNDGWNGMSTGQKALTAAPAAGGAALLVCAVGSVACAAAATRVIPGVSVGSAAVTKATGGDPSDELAAVNGAAQVSDRLATLASGGGPTQTLVTNLSSAPEAGRALSTWNDPQLALTANNGTQVFQGAVPKALLNALQDDGLLRIVTTNMNGVTGTEYRFAASATQYIVNFFSAIG
jgi:RHS repeat-associated protein